LLLKGLLIIKAVSDFSLILGLTSYLFPLLITKTITYVAYASVICVYAYYFLYKSLRKINYYSFMEEFKKGIGYISAVFVMSILSNKLLFFINVTTTYIIIYLILSIVLLRSLRYMEYNKNDKNVNLINLRYSVLVILLSFTLSTNFIRNFLCYTIYQVYHFIINIIISVLSWILFEIGYLLQYFIGFFNRQLNNVNQQQVSVQPNHSPFENIENIKRVDIIGFLKNSILINLIIQVIIVVIIIWLFIWILLRRNNLRQVKDEYIESKEFITTSKVISPLKHIQNIFKTKTSTEYIRLYYLKYLKMCIAERINIKNSDTTLDVYNKSKNLYNFNAINSMREIYIKARYSNLPSGNKEKKEFISFFRKL
jgi:hypothetical protein